MSEPTPPLPPSEFITTHDPLLQRVISAVNNDEGDLAFDVVLNVGGMIVTGEIVSFKRYLEAVEKQEEIKFELDQPSSAEPSSELPPIYPNYIHLKNAQFVMPGSPLLPAKGKVWWRGKLTSVDGFSFGRFRSRKS